MTNVAVNWLSL